MPTCISHRRHGQDKTDLSCPCRRCEIGIKVSIDQRLSLNVGPTHADAAMNTRIDIFRTTDKVESFDNVSKRLIRDNHVIKPIFLTSMRRNTQTRNILRKFVK